MATEDQSNSPPAAANQPDYPKLILEAVESNNSPKGTSKAAISQHIETNNSDLPAGHSALLDYYLKQMKVSGDLVMANGYYLKPDPNAPAKRGRGRPPKVSSSPPDGSVAPPPPSSRGRGRPPKAKGAWDLPAHPKKPPSPVSGRKRGRPAKADKTDEAPAAEQAISAPAAPAGEDTPSKRGRGRPAKDSCTDWRLSQMQLISLGGVALFLFDGV